MTADAPSPPVPFLTSDRCFANWFLTAFCNYRCFYCTNRHCDRPAETWNVDRLVQTLKKTGKKWCLGMTGGEPFAYPGFVSICNKVTQEDITLFIATNLSLEHQVSDFVRNIDPAMVERICVALHIIEREKRQGVDTFLRLIDQLRERGFPFEVQYVLHPTLFHRFEADRAFFARHGITLLAKPFQGTYNGRLYPDSYRADEQELILHTDPDAFRRGFFYARGIPCNAGRYLVNIDKDGTIHRCVSEKTVLGTITTTLSLYTEAQPCKAPFCPCFGWDLIADESVKAALRKKISNKAPLPIRLRRHVGALKRRLLG